MENERKFYHLSTDGMSSDILFKSVAAFIAGMNRIGICAYLLGLPIISFVLMDNHLHIVLYATRDECAAFFRKFKQKMGAWLKMHDSEERLFNKLEPDIRLIETEDYLKNAIVYDIMNPTKAFMPFLPQGYRWSSAILYFSDFSMVMPSFRRVESMSAREVRRLLETKEQLPQNWLISEDGLIWPGCYTDYKFVEGLLKNPLEIVSKMNENIEFKINKDMKDGKISMPDMELREICMAISRGLFGTGKIHELDMDRRIELAKSLHAQTKASYKQIAKVVRVNLNDLLAVFKS